jgi:protein TonB
MAQPEKKTTQQYIIDRLQNVQSKVETNSYADALAIIKEVRAADVKNIYLVAIEKQIAKLTDTSLPQENRTAIVKSLPAMINRTVSDIQRKAPQQPTPPVAEESQKGQKEAALDKLKKQYFQRADEYVEKKEYQHALEEIRRIYIIEPGSVVAKEYEQKIEQLAALQARGEAQTASAEEEKKVAKAAPVVEQPKEKVILEEEPKKSKLPIIAAAAAIVILAVGAWLFLSKGSSNKPADQGQGSTQQPSLTQGSATTTPPVTATSTPPAGKASPSTTGTSKKTNTETKPVAPEKKPIQIVAPAPAKITTQPVPTQQQPVQQAPRATQPAANTQPPAQQQTSPAESTPAPMPFVAIESQPEPIKRVNPVYPDIAIKMGIQGRVTVEVTVDAQGKPIQAKVAKSSSEVFNDAAIEAVMKYTFKPAMMSTGPVVAKVYVPIDFRMRR